MRRWSVMLVVCIICFVTDCCSSYNIIYQHTDTIIAVAQWVCCVGELSTDTSILFVTFYTLNAFYV